ncbi:MAG: hypothetical protein H7X88_04360 [Gloeobacteraceae cyanobacterium ES-bin-316]|nr:hypothetical protein [Ferruginibacter sp.]
MNATHLNDADLIPSKIKYLLLVFCLLNFAGFAQQTDFLILKKKDRPVKNFYAGTQIEFVSTQGAYRNALITAIKNDSIYLQEFLVRRLPTVYGTYINDTAGSFRYIYHYNQIKSFGPAPKKGFNVSGSGAALFGGGVLLTLASAVSYIVDKDKFSPELLAGAVALGTAGYFMSRAGRNGIVIGKKYTLQYINMK